MVPDRPRGARCGACDGCVEPTDAVKNGSRRGYAMTLFVAPRQASKEVWDGPTCGLDGAVEVFGADHAEPNDPSVLLHVLKKTLASAEHLYLSLIHI